MIPRLLVEILDFYKHKINKGDCTDEDMQTAFSLLTEEVVSQATTAQIADFYGQSPSNVRNVLSRYGVSGESKRYYNFAKLQKFIPKSWRESKTSYSDIQREVTAGRDYSIAAEPDAPYGNE